MDPFHPSDIRLGCGFPGLSKGGLCLLHMYPLDLRTPLPHKKVMVARPEFGRPVERHDKVPPDYTGRRPIYPRIPSWVGEGNPGLFDLTNLLGLLFSF